MQTREATIILNIGNIVVCNFCQSYAFKLPLLNCGSVSLNQELVTISVQIIGPINASYYSSFSSSFSLDSFLPSILYSLYLSNLPITGRRENISRRNWGIRSARNRAATPAARLHLKATLLLGKCNYDICLHDCTNTRCPSCDDTVSAENSLRAMNAIIRCYVLDVDQEYG